MTNTNSIEYVEGVVDERQRMLNTLEIEIAWYAERRETDVVNALIDFRDAIRREGTK